MKLLLVKIAGIWLIRRANHLSNIDRLGGLLPGFLYVRNIAILLSLTFSSALASNLSQTASSFPLTFEANGGQVPNRYNYVLHHDGMQTEFSREGVDFFLSGKNGASGALRLQLLTARRDAAPAAEELLNGKSNYLLGSDSTLWIRSVPNYARVRYDEIYPGISLVFYGAGSELEHDFTVAPGADPSSIAFRLTGAKKMTLLPRAILSCSWTREHSSLGSPSRINRPLTGGALSKPVFRSEERNN